MNETLAAELGIAEVLTEVRSMRAHLEQLTAQPEVFTVNEVAGFLRISRDGVYTMLKNGLLWKAEVGSSSVRIPRSAVENALAPPDKRRHLKAVS